MIKHKLAKISSRKEILSSAEFLTDEEEAKYKCCQAADPVAQQKLTLFVIETSSKLQKFFVTYV